MPFLSQCGTKSRLHRYTTKQYVKIIFVNMRHKTERSRPLFAGVFIGCLDIVFALSESGLKMCPNSTTSQMFFKTKCLFVHNDSICRTWKFFCSWMGLLFKKKNLHAPKSNMTPLVLPSQLKQLTHCAVYNLINELREWLPATLSADEVGETEVEFLHIQKDPCVVPVREGSQFEKFASACNNFVYRYRRPHSGIGRLSTVFTGTTNVETDVSFIHCETEALRETLLNLFPAGTLHVKAVGLSETCNVVLV